MSETTLAVVQGVDSDEETAIGLSPTSPNLLVNRTGLRFFMFLQLSVVADEEATASRRLPMQPTYARSEGEAHLDASQGLRVAGFEKRSEKEFRMVCSTTDRKVTIRNKKYRAQRESETLPLYLSPSSAKLQRVTTKASWGPRSPFLAVRAP